MHRTILLGLLLTAAACGRDKGEPQEVAAGDTMSVKIDSTAEETAKTPSTEVTPANEPKPAPKEEPTAAVSYGLSLAREAHAQVAVFAPSIL